MNVDAILTAMNRRGVDYLLIGGMNFMLRHQPVLTYDVDLWFEDLEGNRRRCELALADLAAEWGPTAAQWQSVALSSPGWLDNQFVYCLTSPHGAIDIFRSVKGLSDWRTSHGSSVPAQTSAGTSFRELSDSDMQKGAVNDRLKKSEDLKRDRSWDLRERWRVLQETISWVDSQQRIPRNSRQACAANEARLLGRRTGAG